MRRFICLIFLAASMVAAMAQTASSDCDQPHSRIQFAWGASLTSAVDLTGNDMSSLGMDAYFGMRVPGVQMLGVGAGINVPVSSSLRTLPVYLIARTNFRTRPTLCFLDVRCGISVNDVPHSGNQTGAYASAGVGCNLATGRTFSSHLILAYSFFDRKPYYIDGLRQGFEDVHMATLRLGICF